MQWHFDVVRGAGRSDNQDSIKGLTHTDYIETNTSGDGTETSSEVSLALREPIDGITEGSQGWQCTLRYELTILDVYIQYHIHRTRPRSGA